MRNIAIILAAGINKRFGKTSKLLSKIGDKTIFEYSVEAFEKNENIDSIAIVANPLLLAKFKQIANENNWGKIERFLIGGKERYESSLVAVRTFSSEKNCNLIFHDAARPLISQRIINDITENLKFYSAINTAIPITDSLIIINDDKTVAEVPQRKYYYKSQTPQAFNIKTIKKAFERAFSDNNFNVTDDCEVVKKYLPNEKIHIIAGEEKNIKITYPDDISFCEYLLLTKNISF